MREEKPISEEIMQKTEDTKPLEKMKKKRSSLQWHPPTDQKFASYVEECNKEILTLQSTQKQIEALAR